MTGVLVLSAWALGILNSHRKFFIPYFAPVLWNAAIIGALLGVPRPRSTRRPAHGRGVGRAGRRVSAVRHSAPVGAAAAIARSVSAPGAVEPAFKEVVATPGPAIMGRGVVQVSTYVDMVLASLLAIGALARIRYAQTLYVLPVSLFGMSIAAAELPELARERTAARPKRCANARSRQGGVSRSSSCRASSRSCCWGTCSSPASIGPASSAPRTSRSYGSRSPPTAWGCSRRPARASISPRSSRCATRRRRRASRACACSWRRHRRRRR